MKKTNNKGFSLVELIVVIAIMAVLIAVLAPTYLRFVEKSRNSTDMQNASQIISAVQVWAIDAGTSGTDAQMLKQGTYTITVTATGANTSAEPIKAALDNAGLVASNIKCVSKTMWTSYTLTFTVKSNGTVTITCDQPGVLGNAGSSGGSK